MSPHPTRGQLKDAMLALFLENNTSRKKALSKDFTRMLFEFVESVMEGRNEQEISSVQMEAAGLFATYVFNKEKEKSREGKGTRKILEEIAAESDELFDEIESRAWED